MFQLDFGDRRPLYEQIKDKIKDLIISGAIKENDKVPSVRELASMLAINPNTIQKAYKELENEGYIYSQRAKGSFVSPASSAEEQHKIAELYERLDSLMREFIFCSVPCEDVLGHINALYRQ